jgi:hypothetical protein
MKHVGKDAPDTLSPVLDALRQREELDEKSPASFYLRSKAFVHFHEDAAGLFADLKEDFVSFTRFRVSTRREQTAFLGRVDRCLGGVPARTAARAK